MRTIWKKIQDFITDLREPEFIFTTGNPGVELSPEDEWFYAKQMLENPLLERIFTAMENDLYRKWALSPARDAEGRETLWMYLRIAKKFHNKLRSYLGNKAVVQHKRKERGIV